MLGFIIGLIVGLIPSIIYFIKNRKSETTPPVEKYLRRGIYNLSFNVTRGDWIAVADIQYEVGEVESTDDMSKVEVISLISNQGRLNTPDEKKTFANQINNSWVNSSEIKWINTRTSDRNRKIDEILK